MKPLKALMGKKSDHRWTLQHTSALNKLLELAAKALKLKVADPTQPFEVWVDVEDTDQGAVAGGVVLSQGQG